jgi:flavin reductase (DIM6/NTAB) family NADH-FMN oxidoreductase RutF
VQITTEELDEDSAYRLLIGSVVPRPIAWVTTMSESGVVNAAPFSAFTYVSPWPPLLAVSVGRRNGHPKDTARNIIASREFVVNIADETLLEPLHLSSTEYPPDVSEVEALGLELSPSVLIHVPRLSATPIQMECRLHDIIEFGATQHMLIVGEVVMFHVEDRIIQGGKIATELLHPIARLGGPKYAGLGEITTMSTVPFGSTARGS